MSISAIKRTTAQAVDVEFTEDELVVSLKDGRRIFAPLEWFPRLLHAAAADRQEWRLLGSREGIHWPLLDDDVSVAGLLG